MSAATISGASQQVAPGAFNPRRAARAVVQASLERSWLGTRLFWRIPREAPVVALTFDDGPDPDLTPRILDLLASYGARGTFFVVGEQAARFPELVFRMAMEGHTVGNHTLSHATCPDLEPTAFRYQLHETDAIIRDVCPTVERPIFRPPFGAVTPAQAVQLVQTGRRVALWSRDTRDYRSATVEEIESVGAALESRDILLMHDRFPATLEALPRILDGLAERGLKSVGLGDPEVTGKRAGHHESLVRKVMRLGVGR